jgi:cysteine desulfurase
MERIYLDYAATTPVHPEVVKAMLPYFTRDFGNPSSIHSFGKESKSAIEEARAKVAALVGAQAEEIIFTGGGTESDNMAIKGIASAKITKGNHIITSMIEHHAVLESCRSLQLSGFDITYLPVDRFGLVNPADVRKAITGKTILISIMHANNEIGTIEPIVEISKIAGEAGVCFHTDAVQTAGHIPIHVTEMGVDLLSLSAHKLYGPKGVGALYVKKGVKLGVLINGGEQENRLRAGTENVPGIVGFGIAAELAGKDMDTEIQRQTGLRDKLIEGLLKNIDQSRLNGHPKNRLPNNVYISIEDVEEESILLNLDREGIYVSSRSACSSSGNKPSHVLSSCMGHMVRRENASLRMTLGKWTTEQEVDYVIEVLPRIVSELKVSSTLTRNQ